MPFIRSEDIDISSDITITKHVDRPIVVHSGGVLVLMGICEQGVIVGGGGYARIVGTTHGLFVAAGGHAVLAGTCVGSVTNDGGELSISGIVTGTVITHAGSTQVDPGASVPEHTDAMAETDLSPPRRAGTSPRWLDVQISRLL